MRLRAPAWTAFLSLLPLVIAPAMATPARTVSIALCKGDGSSLALQLPLNRGKLPGGDEEHDCMKACHATGSRKKNVSGRV